ncbi:SURF1 family protein [Herbiconiux sp. YIM B11900]|uniref:SURF1 family protein n=1 Tax=Herbiconiux sp. YIM B11900 TaxID=3404131 RepID=UPI003F8488B9
MSSPAGSTPRSITVFSVMRRPRWIGVLVLALVVAGIFAALGQWQLGRAVSNGEDIYSQTETVRPLADVATPQTPVLESQAAQRVTVSGHFVASGYGILADRLDAGTPGYWVIGQFAVDQPVDTYLAVALGWTADADTALASASALAGGASAASEEVTGRYLPTEAPAASDTEKPITSPATLDGLPLETSMAVASLINRWTEFDGAADVYGGYLVLQDAPPGLAPIASPEPDRSVQLNWLNIFYAAEWVVFAGFAIYFWYRLVRDAWERELEEAAEASGAPGAADDAPDARVS